MANVVKSEPEGDDGRGDERRVAGGARNTTNGHLAPSQYFFPPGAFGDAAFTRNSQFAVAAQQLAHYLMAQGQTGGDDFERLDAPPPSRANGSSPPLHAAPTDSSCNQSLGDMGIKVNKVPVSEQEMYWQYNPGPELYSRKVFVGGLPIDIEEDEINATFSRFGPHVVDWPRRTESHFPPRGYVFLVFEHEQSVQALVNHCHREGDRHYLFVSSLTMREKPVQVRPWRLADADFVVESSMALDPRKTVFIGGVPRPLKAVELAHLMDRLFGGVCYAGIDTDPELKYPKGAARVSFSNQQSFIAAIAGRFVQIQHTEADKRVEVKPYVMDDQMCDECQGARCGGKYAPFFCAHVACLQYYCEPCWQMMHGSRSRAAHKPMAKLGEQGARVVEHFARHVQQQRPTSLFHVPPPPLPSCAPPLPLPPSHASWWPGF